MKSLVNLFLLLYVTATAATENAWVAADKPIPKKPLKELQFLAYFYNQGVVNNVYARNDFLKGQTVGRLFGGNTTTTSDRQTTYFEQRLIPFIIFQPKLMDGNVILRTSFEIDWTWGDASYGVGGNFGSAFSADQVNLQTQNVEIELIPSKGWAVNLGLQRLFDTPYNPYRTFFETMGRTGYRLAFWGSDAVGLTVRQDKDFSRWKAGYYQLYENSIQDKDDVALWEFIYERDITPTWRQGLSLWYVHDRANGEGGVSILSQGLNSLLNDYNGTYRFPIGSNPYKADIFWIGTCWNRNPEFSLGRWMLTGFLVSNIGRVDKNESGWQKCADILGLAANLRFGYRYGQTAEDNVSADLVFATGDANGISDKRYNGIITGNAYGSPGAIFISHGAYYLFPHGNVVNRFISAVADLSNLGRGLFGGTLNFHRDVIPHKLSAKLGYAGAFCQHAPADGGNLIGNELNGRISFQPKVFMNIELHGAYLWLGDFYNSPQVNGNQNQKPANPWTVFVVFKWLLF